MIEKLSPPRKVPGPFGEVSATHIGWGHTYEPWSNPQLVSYSVLGILVGGVFKPVPGTEETISIEEAPTDISHAGVVALHRKEAKRLAAPAEGGDAASAPKKARKR